MAKKVTKAELAEKLALLHNFLYRAKESNVDLGQNANCIATIRGLYKSKTMHATPKKEINEIALQRGIDKIDSLGKKELLFGRPKDSSNKKWGRKPHIMHTTKAYGEPMIQCSHMTLDTLEKFPEHKQKDDLISAIGAVVEFVRENDGANLPGFKRLEKRYLTAKGLDPEITEKEVSDTTPQKI